jgi:hypothetical protein
MMSVLADGGPDGILVLPLPGTYYQGRTLPRISVVVPVTSPKVLWNEWGIVGIRRVP